MKVLAKNDRFPDPKESVLGDMVVLQLTKDLFVFDGKKWILVGGQYLKPESREKLYAYLDEGWEYAHILKYDLLNYLDTSEFFDRTFYERIVDLANKILPPEFDD